jgi:hypothetical protein
MLSKSRYAYKYFTKNHSLYEQKESGITYLKPKKTSLKNRLKCDDPLFIDFVCKMLSLNPQQR